MKLQCLITVFATSTILTTTYAQEKFVPIMMGDGMMTFIPYSTIPQSTSGISEALANTLSYMGNEERLAYDVYNRLYQEWGINQFTNIANNSEVKHIQAVQKLVQTYKLDDRVHFTNVDLPSLGYVNTAVENMKAGTYDIAKIQRLYDDLVTAGSVSETEALKVGCTVEVVDIDDLDDYIKIAEESNASDVIETFNFLRNGSYNHYWSFDRALKNRGMSDGCCTWSELCHPEYPQNSSGNGSGQGNGNGQGRGK